MSTTTKQKGHGESVSGTDSGLNRWQLILIVLGAVAAFAGNILSGPGYAVGSAIGASIIYYGVIATASNLYQRFEWVQLNLIPHRIYIGLCIFAAIITVPSAFLLQSIGNGVFLFFYFMFGGLALVIFAIKKHLF